MRPAARTRASSGAQTNGAGVQVEDTRICVVMVGLPARGKSLIAQKGMPPYSTLMLSLHVRAGILSFINVFCAFRSG